MGNDTSSSNCNECNDKISDGGFTKFKTTGKFPSEWEGKCPPISSTTDQKEDTQEKILSPDGKDRRIRAPTDIVLDNEITLHLCSSKEDVINIHKLYNMGYLQMKFGNKYCRGTGTIINHSLNGSYILTCAHNVVCVQTDPDHSIDEAEAMWFNIRMNIEEKGSAELHKFPAESWAIYPGYQQKGEYKYDLAIIRVIDTDGILRMIKPVQIRRFSSNYNQTQGKVIGYPGRVYHDKKETTTHDLYGMSGDIEYSEDNNMIYYTNIDTSAGQSGSPIFECRRKEQKNDNDNDNDEDIFYGFKKIIGVHTGGSKVKGKNWGTALNDDKLKWIAEILKMPKIIQPIYKCNALLMSSNVKYEKAVNKLCATFNKSQVINCKQIYIDNNDDNTDKAMMLREIETLFKYKRKVYIICFCGDSDKDGNWIFNEQRQNSKISLDDILNIWNGEPDTCDHYSRRGKVWIISDCSYSGACGYQPRHWKYGSDLLIQSSAKNNEKADPGVFISKYAECCLEWELKKWNASKVGRAITGVVVGGTLGMANVYIYDYGIKRLYHKGTKTSTPTSSEGQEFPNTEWVCETNDGMYKVGIHLFNSWEQMDASGSMGTAVKYASFGMSGNQ